VDLLLPERGLVAGDAFPDRSASGSGLPIRQRGRKGFAKQHPIVKGTQQAYNVNTLSDKPFDRVPARKITVGSARTNLLSRSTWFPLLAPKSGWVTARRRHAS
jgi:hypothetical protein